MSWLQAIELADVIGRGKWAIECFDDDHATTAAWARWRFVVGGGRAPRIARRKTRVNALMLGTHIPEAVVMGPRFRGDDRNCG